MVIFQSNTVDMQEAQDIAQELIAELDENQDGKLSMEEFATQYVDLIRRLRTRQIELEDRMLEHYDQYKFNKNKLAELSKPGQH